MSVNSIEEAKCQTQTNFFKWVISLENQGAIKVVPVNSIFYNKVEEKYLIENRHESSKLQEGYDRRFGLVPVRILPISSTKQSN